MQVVEVRKDNTIRVHFDGWSEKWNMTYDRVRRDALCSVCCSLLKCSCRHVLTAALLRTQASTRLAYLGKHTSKKDWKLRGKKRPKSDA